ncbi:MAG: hypothetical protein WCI41_04190 [bacterium]
MTNQPLLDFVKQQLQKGIDKDTISKELLANGWTNQDIEEAFRATNNPIVNNSVVSPAPVVASTSTTPASTPASTFQPIYNSNSPYAGMNTVSTSNNFNSNFSSGYKPKKSSAGKVFLILIILLILGIGGSAYYLRNDLMNLPIVKNIFSVFKPTTPVPVVENQLPQTPVGDVGQQIPPSEVKISSSNDLINANVTPNETPNVPTKTIPSFENVAWTKYEDFFNGISYQYPSSLNNAYIQFKKPEIVVTPKISPTIDADGCLSASQGGETPKNSKTKIGSMDFCLSTSADAAMGTYANYYYYTTLKNKNYYTLEYTIMTHNCSNMQAAYDKNLCSSYVDNYDAILLPIIQKSISSLSL